MKAYVIDEGKVVLRTVPKPVAKDNEVLIKVHAFGLNRADLLQIDGLYPAPDNSNIPGLEVFGILENTGERVAALLPSSAWAEYVAVDKCHIIKIPDVLDDAAAAALPEALVTCWLNLFKLGDIESAKSVLVHGATSGIGSTAIQIAKIYGKEVYGTIGIDEKLERTKFKLSTQNIFNYGSANWAEKIKEHGGVELVLDILGGAHTTNNISVLNKGGRLIQIAVMGGSKSEINIASVLMKNLKIIGSTLRSKNADEKALLIQEVNEILLPKLLEHNFRPMVDSIYKFEELTLAIERLNSRMHFGKVVVFTTT